MYDNLERVQRVAEVVMMSDILSYFSSYLASR